MDWLAQFLTWVDSDVARYWTIGWSALAATALLSLLPELPWLFGREQPPAARAWRVLTSRWLYLVAVAFTFAAFRWPTWFLTEFGNPDESQMIAGAITLRHDPVFWRAVDGTTHGPLDDYVLLLPTLFGGSLGYSSARFFGTLLHFACLLGIGAAARRLFSETSARIGLLPAVAWLGSTTFGDFFQYNSEMLPLALLGSAAAAGCAALTTARPAWRLPLLAIAGGLLGAVPFAKLQGMPVAITTTLLIAAGIAWQARGRTLADFIRPLLAFAGGLLVPATLFAAMLVSNGLVGDFWQAYIRNNLLYANEYGFSWSAALERWPVFMRMVPGYTENFVGHGIAAALLLVASLLGTTRTRWLVGAAWLVFASSFFAVLAPNRHFMHYLQFLIPAFGLLLAAQYHGAREFLATAPVRLRWLPLAVLGLAALAPVVYTRWLEPADNAGRFRDRASVRPSPAVFVLQRDAAPGDRIAMWGWQPNLYVETGLAQGTRDAHTAFLLIPGALRDYYRARYLADFRRNRPAWFVDAVGPGRFCYVDRKVDGYETYPELAALVQSEYAFVADVEGYRIYRRK